MLLLNESEILSKSLAYGNNLKFKDFVEYNNIDLNSIFVDKIFHNIHTNLPIYMDDAMIEYFGYSGDLKSQSNATSCCTLKLALMLSPRTSSRTNFKF